MMAPGRDRRAGMKGLRRRDFLAGGLAGLGGPLAFGRPALSAAPEPAEAAIEPGLPIIDCHHHLWDVSPFDGTRYLADELLRDVSAGHNIRATVYIEAHSRYRPDGPEPLRAVGETEFANQVAERHADRRLCAGIVAHADLLQGAAVEPVLAAHREAAPARLRGIRDRIASRAVRGDFEDRKQILQPAFRDALRLLARHGLSFEAFAYHPYLGDVAQTARACPDTLFVLNHLGGPLRLGPYEGRTNEIFAAWKQGIAAVAQLPNVVIKLGGVGMETAGFGWEKRQRLPGSDELARVTRPWYLHAIDCFGPGRCLFESNFPPDRLSSSYVTLWNAHKKLSAGFSGPERAAMFHDNARRVYRL
jgi:L-fuconolactonase